MTLWDWTNQISLLAASSSSATISHREQEGSRPAENESFLLCEEEETEDFVPCSITLYNDSGFCSSALFGLDDYKKLEI